MCVASSNNMLKIVDWQKKITLSMMVSMQKLKRSWYFLVLFNFKMIWTLLACLCSVAGLIVSKFSYYPFCILKCHCNEKIFDPFLNTTKQHFDTSLNGIFSFSKSCFALEILRFFETCKLGVSDVIYSWIINYIYQMVNISVNSRHFAGLCFPYFAVQLIGILLILRCSF